MSDKIKVDIFFSFNSDSSVSRWIALYSYYRCIEKKGKLESIWRTLKNDFPLSRKVKTKGQYETVPTFVFSHAGLLVKNPLKDDYDIVEISNVYGVNRRRNDLFKDVISVKEYFGGKLKVYYRPNGYVAVIGSYEIDPLEWDKRYSELFIEHNEGPKLLGIFRYDFGDILSYIVPIVHGSRRALICSEFVEKMLPEAFGEKGLTCFCEVPSPNDLFYYLLADEYRMTSCIKEVNL